MKVIGIKFKDGGKIYYFAPNEGEEYEAGVQVVVETSKGLEFATVAFPPKEVDDSEVVQPLKPIVRIATEKDKEQVRRNQERKPQAMKLAQEKIEKHNLAMKLIDCEFAFDGSKVIFYFSAESRVDFRDLVKDLAGAFHIRIELRQVGIRDETRLLGGHRALRQGVLLRRRDVRLQKGVHQDGEGAGGCRSTPARSAGSAVG